VNSLCGELHVPYRSPQQYFTNDSERDGVNKNDPNLMNHLLTGVTGGDWRKKNATVKYDALCRSFQLPEV